MKHSHMIKQQRGQESADVMMQETLAIIHHAEL